MLQNKENNQRLSLLIVVEETQLILINNKLKAFLVVSVSVTQWARNVESGIFSFHFQFIVILMLVFIIIQISKGV